MPEQVYRMPATWDEADGRAPVPARASKFERVGGLALVERFKDAPEGHIITETLDWSSTNKPGRKAKPENATSIARCQCGALFKALNQKAALRHQDAEIQKHWADVRRAAAEVPAPAEAPPAIAAE